MVTKSAVEVILAYLQYQAAARSWHPDTPAKNMADAFRELDDHLSNGGVLPDAWAGARSDDTLHAIVIEYVAEDMLSQYEDETKAGDLGMLIESIVPGGCDRLASWAVGHHMTPVEIVVWAGARWPHCRAVMRGDV